jgi:hypothetical protein
MRTRASNQGEQSGRDDPDRAAGIAGGFAVAGRQLRRVLRTRALRPRQLPRTASPPPAATGPHRNAPGVARREPVRPSGIAPGMPRAGRKARPGRNATHCPGRSLPRQGRACGASPRRWAQAPTLDPGDLYRPSGPDGEGQAEGPARTRAANLPAAPTGKTRGNRASRV